MDREFLSGERSERFSSFAHKFYLHNLREKRQQCYFVARALCILVALGGVLFYSVTGLGVPRNNVECMQDNLFELTSPINKYFRENDLYRHLLLIFSSSLIDFQYLYFCFKFMFWGKSARPIVFLVCFYSFRAFIQNIFLMKYPADMAWDYPGLPSFTVSYAYTSDFFFSGHVGIMVFISLENFKERNFIMLALSAFSVFAEFFVMLVLRGHYSIDLFSGIIFSHYFWILANYFTNKIESPEQDHKELKAMQAGVSV